MSLARHLGVVHRLLDRAHAALHQIVREFLELRPIDGHGEVLGAVGVGSDKRQVDLRLCHRRQFHLRLLGRLEQPLQRLRIFAQIDVVLALELVGQIVHEPAVEVVATQMGITCRGANLDHPVTDVEKADIERAAAEVEDQHGLVALLVQPVGQCRGRGLVDDAQHIQPGDPAGILGGVALRVVEVRRNGDHRFLDPFAEELAASSTSLRSTCALISSASTACRARRTVRRHLALDDVEAHDRGGQMLRSAGVGGDERQIDLGLRHRRQFDLGLLGRLEQPLQRLRIFPQIDVVLTLELIGQVVDEPAVEVIATQVRITGRGAHLDHPVTHVEQADVERAAAEVEDQHRLVALLVQPVGQRRGRGLVDDAQHVQPGDPAGILGGVALGVVEIRRNGDHRFLDPLTEELARVVDEFAQHLRADLLRRVLLAAHVEPGGATLALDDVEADRLGFLRYLVEAAADESSSPNRWCPSGS